MPDVKLTQNSIQIGTGDMFGVKTWNGCFSRGKDRIVLEFNNGRQIEFLISDNLVISGTPFSGTIQEKVQEIADTFFEEAPVGGGEIIGDGVTHIVALSQAEYDALEEKDAETLYFIV